MLVLILPAFLCCLRFLFSHRLYRLTVILHRATPFRCACAQKITRPKKITWPLIRLMPVASDES
jgi:hypothetical protein